MGGRQIWVYAIACTGGFLLAAHAQAQLVFKDISYDAPGSNRNMLDVIKSTTPTARGTPTIVYIHGGGWSSRDKRDDMTVYLRLARHGYSVVPCNYTLAVSGSPSFPQAVQDVKNVVRWVRTEGQHFGLSPRIVVFGPSSGGHLAMMAAVTSGDPLFETLSPPLGGYRPDAFISFAGFSDLEWHASTFGQNGNFMRFLGAIYEPATAPLYQSGSPNFHVSACDPPGAFIHGTSDTVVPHQHSIFMAEALRAHGKFVSVSLLEDAGHTYEAFGGPLGMADRIAEQIGILMPYTRTPDLNGDGQLTTEDFDAFMQLFDARDPRADMNNDGRFTHDDYVGFMRLYARGCF